MRSFGGLSRGWGPAVHIENASEVDIFNNLIYGPFDGGDAVVVVANSTEQVEQENNTVITPRGNK